jgi:ArsR family transcriptional regulator
MQVTQRQVEMCAALGDVHRLLLLYALADEPHNVGELAQRVGLSQPAVSHHLRILRESGVVDAERRGKQMVYFPLDARIFEVLDLLRAISIDQMQRQGDAAQSAAQRPTV